MANLRSFAVVALAVMLAAGVVVTAVAPPCARTASCVAFGSGMTVSHTCVGLKPGAKIEFSARQCTTDVWDYVVEDENAHVYVSGDGSGHNYIDPIRERFTLEGSATNLTFTLTCNDPVCSLDAYMQLPAGGLAALPCLLERIPGRGRFTPTELARARAVRDALPARVVAAYYWVGDALRSWPAVADGVARWVVAPAARIVLALTAA